MTFSDFLIESDQFVHLGSYLIYQGDVYRTTSINRTHDATTNYVRAKLVKRMWYADDAFGSSIAQSPPEIISLHHAKIVTPSEAYQVWKQQTTPASSLADGAKNSPNDIRDKLGIDS